jgi:hypothetical protein
VALISFIAIAMAARRGVAQQPAKPFDCSQSAAARALCAMTRAVQQPANAVDCSHLGPTTVAYLRCMAGHSSGVVSTVARRDLPNQALHVSTSGVYVRIIAGAVDSVSWYIPQALHAWRWASDTATLYRAAPGRDAYELHVAPDSLELHNGLENVIVLVPADLPTLQVDVEGGSVSVEDFAGQLAITMTKGFVAVVHPTGPALIENRDGAVRVILTATRLGQESTLKSSLNILARNGDIELTFPAAIHATLDAEAHQGTIVDAPMALSRWQGGNDTIPVKTHPVLGLQDNELRKVHRDFNGGGAAIKLVTLNGIVTLIEQLPVMQR